MSKIGGDLRTRLPRSRVAAMSKRVMYLPGPPPDVPAFPIELDTLLSIARQAALEASRRVRSVIGTRFYTVQDFPDFVVRDSRIDGRCGPWSGSLEVTHVSDGVFEVGVFGLAADGDPRYLILACGLCLARDIVTTELRARHHDVTVV